MMTVQWIVAVVLVLIGQPSTREIVLTVNVVDDAGAAVPKVPLMASVNGKPAPSSSRSESDPSGKCVLVVSAPSSACELVVACMSEQWAQDPHGEHVENVRSFLEVTASHSLKKWYRLDVAENEASATLSITAPRAVKVNGHVVLPANSPGGAVARA